VAVRHPPERQRDSLDHVRGRQSGQIVQHKRVRHLPHHGLLLVVAHRRVRLRELREVDLSFEVELVQQHPAQRLAHFAQTFRERAAAGKVLGTRHRAQHRVGHELGEPGGGTEVGDQLISLVSDRRFAAAAGDDLVPPADEPVPVVRRHRDDLNFTEPEVGQPVRVYGLGPGREHEVTLRVSPDEVGQGPAELGAVGVWDLVHPVQQNQPAACLQDADDPVRRRVTDG
jgi:hypothetical protein